jgi:hypothetical protein
MTESFKICERCGLREPINNAGRTTTQFVSVGIMVNFQNSVPNRYDARTHQDWCRECVMRVGLHPPTSESERKLAPATPPTLEEQLIEVLRCFVQENSQQ